MTITCWYRKSQRSIQRFTEGTLKSFIFDIKYVLIENDNASSGDKGKYEISPKVNKTHTNQKVTYGQHQWLYLGAVGNTESQAPPQTKWIIVYKPHKFSRWFVCTSEFEKHYIRVTQKQRFVGVGFSLAVFFL